MLPRAFHESAALPAPWVLTSTSRTVRESVSADPSHPVGGDVTAALLCVPSFVRSRAWHRDGAPERTVAWSEWMLAGREAVELDVSVALGPLSSLLFCFEANVLPGRRCPGLACAPCPALGSEARMPPLLPACVQGEGQRSGACPDEAPGTSAQPGGKVSLSLAALWGRLFV